MNFLGFPFWGPNINRHVLIIRYYRDSLKIQTSGNLQSSLHPELPGLFGFPSQLLCFKVQGLLGFGFRVWDLGSGLQATL